jgi:hypothetical protein
MEKAPRGEDRWDVTSAVVVVGNGTRMLWWWCDRLEVLVEGRGKNDEGCSRCR